mmetsp:Transcript_25360/g.29012  ORF Transcript_25360/g.29012 Transcript_25360/m.29012 type:complete len:94 (+) Transcript_25360:1440-1721(+)
MSVGRTVTQCAMLLVKDLRHKWVSICGGTTDEFFNLNINALLVISDLKGAVLRKSHLHQLSAKKNQKMVHITLQFTCRTQLLFGKEIGISGKS